MSLSQDVTEALEGAELWYVATTDGTNPNVVPVGYKWLHEGSLLLADLFFDKTRSNLENNPRVAVTVATPTPKTGFQIKGQAMIHGSGPLYQLVKQKLADVGVELPLHATVQISAEQVYLLEPGADAGKLLSD